MPKYRATQDVPGTDVKKGEIVTFKEDLVDGYKQYFTPVDGKERVEGEEDDNGGNGGGGPGDLTANPDRAALKARAKELELNVADNTPTARLIELIKEAEEKAS